MSIGVKEWLAAGLIAVPAVLYIATRAIDDLLLTKLETNLFLIVFIGGWAVGGFVGSTAFSHISNRLARRLVVIASLALSFYACGSSFRALAVSQLFKGEVRRHELALAIAGTKAGKVGLRSPYTGTVFYIPAILHESSESERVALFESCARVLVEETSLGAVRIAPDQPAIVDANVGPCRRTHR